METKAVRSEGPKSKVVRCIDCGYEGSGKPVAEMKPEEVNGKLETGKVFFVKDGPRPHLCAACAKRVVASHSLGLAWLMPDHPQVLANKIEYWLAVGQFADDVAGFDLCSPKLKALMDLLRDHSGTIENEIGELEVRLKLNDE